MLHNILSSFLNDDDVLESFACVCVKCRRSSVEHSLQRTEKTGFSIIRRLSPRLLDFSCLPSNILPKQKTLPYHYPITQLNTHSKYSTQVRTTKMQLTYLIPAVLAVAATANPLAKRTLVDDITKCVQDAQCVAGETVKNPNYKDCFDFCEQAKVTSEICNIFVSCNRFFTLYLSFSLKRSG